MKTYKEQGRINKKLTRDRKKRNFVSQSSKTTLFRLPTTMEMVWNPLLENKTDKAPETITTFLFTRYKTEIEKQYYKHFAAKLRHYNDIMERALPLPNTMLEKKVLLKKNNIDI